jgi:ABC-type dipeptide/oligopeptide/nickel transport system permease subunit
MGTDTVGRDVFSRLLNGGRSVFALGLVATLIGYAIGVPVGLAAGYKGSYVDALLMRGVDLALVVPTLLTALLAMVAFGRSPTVLVCIVGVLQAPYISRVVRAVTLDIRTRGYVEAALMRGDSAGTIIRHDILPNISSPILADLGLRFAYAIILVATVNYLGLGLSPPASDWSLMIAENQQIMNLNPWSMFAPAAVLALLAVTVGTIGDAVARDLGARSRLDEAHDVA